MIMSFGRMTTLYRRSPARSLSSGMRMMRTLSGAASSWNPANDPSALTPAGGGAAGATTGGCAGAGTGVMSDGGTGAGTGGGTSDVGAGAGAGAVTTAGGGSAGAGVTSDGGGAGGAWTAAGA